MEIETIHRDDGPGERSWGWLLGRRTGRLLWRLSVTPWCWYTSPRQGGRIWTPLALTLSTWPDDPKQKHSRGLRLFVGPLMLGIYWR